MMSLRWAGLMAGGNGSRLVASGIDVPKPLLQVSGRPLVTYFLDQAAEVGVQRVVAAVQGGDPIVPPFLAQDTRFEWKFVETDGTGTLHAVKVLTEALGGEEHLISTCDVLLPPGTLTRFMKAVGTARKRRAAMVLLATQTVYDTMPIWLRTDAHDPSRVVGLGKDIPSTGLVFGHVRWASSDMRSVMQHLPLDGLTRDTKFLAMLTTRPGLTIFQDCEPDVIDIDDADDLAFAEKLIAQSPHYAPIKNARRP